jgi:hypothetical protein
LVAGTSGFFSSAAKSGSEARRKQSRAGKRIPMEHREWQKVLATAESMTDD